MWLKNLFSCFAIALCFNLAAQSIPTSRILGSVDTDHSVRFQEQHVALMNTTKGNLPFAEELSLRTETDRFDPARQEYLARLSVNGLNEMRHTRTLHQMEIQSATQEQQLHIHEALVVRYAAIANYYLALKAYALDSALTAVYDDRFLVLRKIAAAQPGEAADDLIRTEYDRDEVQLELLNDSARLTTWRQQIKMWLPDLGEQWVLDTQDFISMEKMEAVVERIPMTGTNNPYVGEKQTDIALLAQEYKLTKASSNKMLDFVQLRYSDQASQPVRNDFGLGIGISLPFRGSSKPKLAELAIDQHEADMELLVLTNQLEHEAALAKNKLLSLTRQYRHAQQQWGESQAKYTLAQSANTQLDGPITMLRARELQLHRELNLLDLEKEILENYLLVLDLTGYISSEPRVNYLSDVLEGW